MTTRTNTTLRLSAEEREDIEAIMKQYGFIEMAPFIRFAIRQLYTNETKQQ